MQLSNMRKVTLSHTREKFVNFLFQVPTSSSKILETREHKSSAGTFAKTCWKGNVKRQIYVH